MLGGKGTPVCGLFYSVSGKKEEEGYLGAGVGAGRREERDPVRTKAALLLRILQKNRAECIYRRRFIIRSWLP